MIAPASKPRLKQNGRFCFDTRNLQRAARFAQFQQNGFNFVVQLSLENQESFSPLKHYRPYRCIPYHSRFLSLAGILRLILAFGLTLGALGYRAARAQNASPPPDPTAEQASREGIDAFQRQDYATAMRLLRPVADGGNARAELVVCMMYYDGKGVPRDFGQALAWCRKAADQGLAFAQARVGRMYFRGQSVPEDNTEAANWFRKAANQDDVEGEFSLGTMYLNAWGVPKDDTQAAIWMRKAAEHGLAPAQTTFGKMHLQGQGVTEDDAQAASWLRKAADQGNTDGQNVLGMLYEIGRGVPRDYGLAMQWFRKSADQGDTWGETLVGSMYRDGLGVPVDSAQAKSWYRKAADKGFEPARTKLAELEASASAQTTQVHVPGAIEFICFFDSGSYRKDSEDIRVKNDACLRENWKRLFGSMPFPND